MAITNVSGGTNWTAVRLSLDLEETPLEIKTDSALGSEDQLAVWFYTSQDEPVGRVLIHFTSTPQYTLWECVSKADFPTSLPIAVEKTWRITLNRSSGVRLQIRCNGEDVLDFLMSDETCGKPQNDWKHDWGDDWSIAWSRDVEKIFFPNWDSASDYFKYHQPSKF